MADIRIAYDCSTWGRDGFPKCLDEISELGFWGVEAPGEIVKQYYDKLYAFRQIMALKGLRLAAMSGDADLSGAEDAIEKETAYAKMVCEFLAGNRGEVFVLNAGPRRAEGPAPDDYKRLAEFCNQVGEFSRALGIKTCVLPRLGRIVENRADIERLLELADPALVCLCPDTGLLAKQGEHPAEVIRAHVGRVGHVHFKDVEMRGGAQPSQGSAEFYFAELGKGCVDFPAVLEVLRGAAYKGCITIELDKTRLTPKESAAISKAYIENVLGIPVHPKPVHVITEPPVRAPQQEPPSAEAAKTPVETPSTEAVMPAVEPPAPEAPKPAAEAPPHGGSDAEEERSDGRGLTPEVASPQAAPALAPAPEEQQEEALAPETPPAGPPPPPQQELPPEAQESKPPAAGPQAPSQEQPPRDKPEERKEHRGFGYGILPEEPEKKEP
jgi:inosose dehydratase